jgi:hypothetical protein
MNDLSLIPGINLLPIGDNYGIRLTMAANQNDSIIVATNLKWTGRSPLSSHQNC